MKLGIAANIVAFICLAVVSGLVSYFLSFLGYEVSEALRLWGVSIICSLVLVFIFRRQIFAVFWRGLMKLLVDPKNRLGVRNIYGNFADASVRIAEKFSKSDRARVMIQLGRGVIGGSRSLLFEPAKKRRGGDSELRILYAAEDAPHLSRGQAKKRGSVYSEWTSSISYTEGSIQALQEAGVRVSSRCHREPYLWRLFFFDSTLFLVPYLFESNNSELAPVIEIEKGDKGSGSLYSTFEKYFEEVWARATVE